MCHTLMQISAQRQAYLNVLPRRSLCSTKIMQTESKEASWLANFAEVQLILCKDSKFLVQFKGFYEKKSLEGRNFIVVAILPSCVSTTFVVLVA